jgi:hypothetical protein
VSISFDPPIRFSNLIWFKAGVIMLKPNMPSIEEQEGATVPVGLPPVIDAHVHIFPPNIFSAIWKWFDENAWHTRYQMASSEIFDLVGQGGEIDRELKPHVFFQ